MRRINGRQIKRRVESERVRVDSTRGISEGNNSKRGMKQTGFDGIAELWWDSLESVQAALAMPAGQAASALLAEDEARFIDMEASTIFFTEENEVVAFD